MTFKSQFLKITTIGIGIVVLLFATLFNIQIFTAENHNPLPSTIIIGIVAIEVIFLLALAAVYFVYKIITKIIANDFFTTTVLTYIQRIKQVLQGIFLFSLFTLPMFYWIALGADAPGVVLFGLGLCFIPFVAALFLSVIKELFQQMILIKEENDFTV